MKIISSSLEKRRRRETIRTHLRIEVRDLLQRRIRLPHGLDAHLREIHRSQSTHERVRGHDVHTSGEETDDLSEDDSLVGSEVGGKDHPREVSLEENEGFEVRGLVILGLELDGRSVVDPLEDDVLVVTDGDVLELRRRRDDLEKTLELGSFAEGHAEDLDGDVGNVVVCEEE